MKSGNRTTVLLLAAIGGAVGAAQAQPDASVQHTVTRALELQRGGQWEEAQSVLERGIQDCGSGDKAQSCQSALHYSAGYCYEQWSQEAAPGQAEPLLRRAERHYLSVLEAQPGHGPTLNNLAVVYQRLGQKDRAMRLWAEAAKSDPARAARYLLLAGDAAREDGKFADARRAYREAVERDPDAGSPKRRLIDTYRLEESPNLAELMTQCAQWSDRFLEVALYGYEVALRKSYRTDRKTAEEALVRWAETLARTGSISRGRLSSLPPDWDHAGARDLAAYLESPWSPVPSQNWWLGSAVRRDVMGKLALALGNDPGWSKGNSARAEKCWRVGADAAPPYEEYMFNDELKESRGTRLELQTALALLYQNYPQLDPNQEKFRKIESELFGGKNIAYKLEDLEAIQRHHTVLGLIYAAKGIWRSESPYKNAIFQLSHAIETADRRGFYQPLPELKARLAEGYEKAGNTRMATRTYLTALEAYLDTDDLEQASATQAKLERVAQSLTDGQKKTLGQLTQILRTRQDVATGRSNPLAGSPGGPVLDREKAPGLLPIQGSDLRPEFLERQRFKVVSDAVIRERERNPQATPTAREVAAASAAFRLATEGSSSLIGTGDLIRLEKVNAVAGEATKAPAQPRVIRKQDQPKDAGKAVPIYLPTDSRPRYVYVEREHPKPPR